jgi:hypothetical protein
MLSEKKQVCISKQFPIANLQASHDMNWKACTCSMEAAHSQQKVRDGARGC